MTYTLMNLCFLAVAALVVWLAHKHLSTRGMLAGLVVVLALTALFDPVIIGLDIVRYNPEKLLGVYWLNAPVEDFAYAIVAVPLVASLWHLLERPHER